MAHIAETSNLKQPPLIWHKQKILLTLAWTRFRIPLGSKKNAVPNILLAIAMELKFAENIIVSTKTEVIYLQTPRAFLMSPVAAATFW